MRGGEVGDAGGEEDGGEESGDVPPEVAVHAVADFMGEDGFELLVGESFEEGIGHEEVTGEREVAQDGGVGDGIVSFPYEDVFETEAVVVGEGVELCEGGLGADGGPDTGDEPGRHEKQDKNGGSGADVGSIGNVGCRSG